MEMKKLLFVFLVFTSGPVFAQSLTLTDLDTIVSKQDRKQGLNADVYRFIETKIRFSSIYGHEDSSGKFQLTGETFKNTGTKEIFWVEVQETNAHKKIISCVMGYTAPEPVIRKMEQDLQRNGYRYRKRKKYYIKRKSRKEYILAKIKHTTYVSEFDDQPEILFTAFKQLK